MFNPGPFLLGGPGIPEVLVGWIELDPTPMCLISDRHFFVFSDFKKKILNPQKGAVILNPRLIRLVGCLTCYSKTQQRLVVD